MCLLSLSPCLFCESLRTTLSRSCSLGVAAEVLLSWSRTGARQLVQGGRCQAYCSTAGREQLREHMGRIWTELGGDLRSLGISPSDTHTRERGICPRQLQLLEATRRPQRLRWRCASFLNANVFLGRFFSPAWLGAQTGITEPLPAQRYSNSFGGAPTTATRVAARLSSDSSKWREEKNEQKKKAEL